tara:strand:- start:448 stop:900 length:453 start_codon:yes stop_codon:yes gene_type:complete
MVITGRWYLSDSSSFLGISTIKMKYIILTLIIFTNFESMAKQISEFKWEKRLVIISFESKNDEIFLSSQKFISENKCSIEDRNLEFIFFENYKSNIFEIPNFIKNKFGIWLIGYDGMIKDYSKNDIIFLRLFKLIDAMPMRKNEMKNEKC